MRDGMVRARLLYSLTGQVQVILSSLNRMTLVYNSRTPDPATWTNTEILAACMWSYPCFMLHIPRSLLLQTRASL